MSRPAFIISAAVWGVSLSLVFWWSFAPLFAFPKPPVRVQTTAADDTDALLEAQVSVELPDESRTKQLYRIRLAPLVQPVPTSLADAEPPEQPPFDFRNWAVRETKRRAFFSFLGLMLSGSLLQWLLNRWAQTQPDEVSSASAS